MRDEQGEQKDGTGMKFVVDTGGQPLEVELRDALLAVGGPGSTIKVGPVPTCQACGYFDCVCNVRKYHFVECRFRKAMEAKVGIACDDHGLDVCLVCDPCTCPIT